MKIYLSDIDTPIGNRPCHKHSHCHAVAIKSIELEIVDSHDFTFRFWLSLCDRHAASLFNVMNDTITVDEGTA